MIYGIIAEGKGDCAVLENILWSVIGDDDELRFLRPEFEADESDLQNKEGYQKMTAEQFSSWTWVRKDCEDQTKLQSFLIDNNYIQEERAILVQIDSAECDLYGVERPDKTNNPEYCTTLRQAIVEQINTWLDHQYGDQLYYAVCVEELEAWLLPLYEAKPSHTSAQPKEKLEKFLDKRRKTDKKFKRKEAAQSTEYSKMSFYSKPLRKAKELQKVRQLNPSLDAFLSSLTPSTPSPEA